MVKLIAHPVTGMIITPSANNPEWGTVRVDGESKEFSNGIFSLRKRTAFIRGRIEDLNQIFKKEGQTLPGHVVRNTNYEPFYQGQDPVMNPSTGEVVLMNGREFYQEFVYTENQNQTDSFSETQPEKANVASQAEKL